MKSRKLIAYIAGIIAFIGIGTLITIGVQNIWPGYSPSEHPIERLFTLFVSGVIASSIYNMIKGDEPEIEVNENQKITRDEVSKRLEEMRNSGKYITIDKSHTEIPESKVEAIESNNYGPLNEDKYKIEENDLQKTDLSIVTPTSETHGSEIDKNVYSKPVEIEPKAELNGVNGRMKSISELREDNIETVRNAPPNIDLNQSNSCHNCGGSNIDIAQYCAFCGSKLDLEYASVVGRFFALLIDWIILAVASFSLLIGTSIIYDGNDDIIFLIWVILTIFIGFLYFMVFEGPFMRGRTIGKIAASIRVVDEKSRETISYTQSFIRNLLLIIDIMPYFLPYLLGLISVLASKKNQRIGDMAAKTIVVKDSEKTSKTLIDRQEQYQHGNK